MSEEPKLDDEPRPRVTGYIEPDEASAPLLLAIGRAVVGAAALEATLKVEVARLLYARHAAGGAPADTALANDLSRVDKLTAGRLLKILQKLGLPSDLDERIQDTIARRNDLVHRTFEDPELARAVSTDTNVDPVIKRIDRLALDCGELAMEFHMFAIPKLFELTGRSPGEVAELISAIDPNTVADPRERKQLETAQAIADSENLSALLEDLEIADES